MTTLSSVCLFAPRPPVVILGVPFDVVTRGEAVALIEQMVAARRPHYVVTPNVDFLVQASEDIELRRILFDAHLVVCDGTPLVWASRWLGNPLPERVAGSDLVPLLISLAAQKGYRIFFLGATEAAAERAVANLRSRYPELIIAGHYSPPFNQLLEMDHERIRERIAHARPDLLLVGFGCPKQEKWIAMHYRALDVPVVAGVGGTIDFLAGHIKRAPLWMQHAGAEWVFRLSQEPQRLFHRYRKDLWVFGRSILRQWWQLRPQHKFRRCFASSRRLETSALPVGETKGGSLEPWDAAVHRFELPCRMDCGTVSQGCLRPDRLPQPDRHWFLDGSRVEFIDSTGVGWLIRFHKKLKASDCLLVLVAPSEAIRRALALLRLDNFFKVAENAGAAQEAIEGRLGPPAVTMATTQDGVAPGRTRVRWHGEVTAVEVAPIWEQTLACLREKPFAESWQIDLSDVRFIDSSGLGLLVRLKKLARDSQKDLALIGMQPAVQNVIKVARLTEYLSETICHCT